MDVCGHQRWVADGIIVTKQQTAAPNSVRPLSLQTVRAIHSLHRVTKELAGKALLADKMAFQVRYFEVLCCCVNPVIGMIHPHHTTSPLGMCAGHGPPPLPRRVPAALAAPHGTAPAGSPAATTTTTNAIGTKKVSTAFSCTW